MDVNYYERECNNIIYTNTRILLLQYCTVGNFFFNSRTDNIISKLFLNDVCIAGTVCTVCWPQKENKEDLRI
jgi:hypothetical protein